MALALGCGFPAIAEDASRETAEIVETAEIENFGANVVRNGSFAAGLEHWIVDTTERDAQDSTGHIGAGGCPDSQCLQLNVQPGDQTIVKQRIRGLVPGRRYAVEVKVHASKRQHVRIILHDPDWKGPQCARKPLSMFAEYEGADDWQTLRTIVSIPVRDPCSSTKDHSWQLEVEFVSLRGARPGVMLNDLRVVGLSEPASLATGMAPPLCAYFRDYENLDPCPDTASLRAAATDGKRLATAGKWMLDEGQGALIHDYVAGRNGVIESFGSGQTTEWQGGALFLSGEPGSRVRVDSGQPIDGETFELSLEVSPASDFVQGCLLASQPEGSSLGGFRLCVSQATQVLSFEMSNGTIRREYASIMAAPLEPQRFTSIRVRGHAGALEVYVDDRRIKRFLVPRLRLTKSPYPLVIGAGVVKSEAGFRGKIRNVTMRDTASAAKRKRAIPLGFVSRGSWSLNEGAGIVIHDRASKHHGLIESSPKRDAAQWHGDRLHFGGTSDAGGVLVRDAGPLYGNDFEIQLEVMFDEPRIDWGSLMSSKTASGVLGGFNIFYRGHKRELEVKLADGERQVEVQVALPFDIPAHEWTPILLRFVHDQLEVAVSGVVIGSFDFPEFELAEARKQLLIGAYYYPPTKGVKGSIRNVELLMRSESISETEGEIKLFGSAKTDTPCRAKPLRETMIVGSNLLVPNWLGATCTRRLSAGARFEYIVEVPTDFELVASGASQVKNGKVVENTVKKIGKGMRDGLKTRRYRVELGYRWVVGGESGFGPLFIRAHGKPTETPGTALPRMYFQEAERVGLEEPDSVALLAKAFPVLPTATKLHHSLAWMGLHNSMSWPNFLENYGGLGFNTVPVLVSFDTPIDKKTRSKFLGAARRKGFDLLVVDSAYHRMAIFAESRIVDSDGVRKSFIDPSYRGTYYWEELERIATRNREVKPEWYMMDIECFVGGANACLIGNAPECSAYLSDSAQSQANNPAGAVTDLGVELIFNIRDKLQEVLPGGVAPRMGGYNSEPNQTYGKIFDFNKLYDDVVDYAQPVVYSDRPERLGLRLRRIRALMARGDIIPWMDPGTIREYPSIWIYDKVLEVFGSGSLGIAWFAYANFEGADFYHVARAMEAVIPVEDVIVGSEPMAPIEVQGPGVSATGLSNGSHHLLLLSDYTDGATSKSTGKAEHRVVELRLPVDVQGTLWDLARKQSLGDVDGHDLTIEWRPGIEGARTALYYVGPAPFASGRFKID